MNEKPDNEVTGHATAKREPAARWMDFLARIISGFWAGFWIFFAVATSAADFNSRGGASLGGILIPLAWTVILLLLALTAWRWVRIGRIALPLAGLAVLAGYPIIAGHLPVSTRAFVMASLGLPPLSAGVLLIAARRVDRISLSHREAKI
jgi:hypothetical protein